MLSSESMPLRERLLRRLLFWLPKMCFLSQPLAPLLLASDIMTFPLQQMQAGSFLSRINCGLSNTHDKAIDSSWSRRISSTQLLDSYCEWQTAEDLQSHSISVGICRAAVLTPWLHRSFRASSFYPSWPKVLPRSLQPYTTRIGIIS